MQMYLRFVKNGLFFSENDLILTLADAIYFMDSKMFKEWMSNIF